MQVFEGLFAEFMRFANKMWKIANDTRMKLRERNKESATNVACRRCNRADR